MQGIIVFPPPKPRTPPRQSTQTGDGYSLWMNAVGGPILNLRQWTPQVAELFMETRIKRVSIEEEWAEPTIDALLPWASTIEEMQLRSEALVDASSLAAFPMLRVLRAAARCELIPFARLGVLRTCVIAGGTSLGSVHDAPALEDVTLSQMKRVRLEPLSSLVSLRRFTLIGTSTAVQLDGLADLSLEAVTLRQVARLGSLGPLKKMPLRTLEISNAPSAQDIETIASITSIETLRLENAGKPGTLDFVTTLSAMQEFYFTDRRPTAFEVSVKPLLACKVLRGLTLSGENSGLRNLSGIEVIGELTDLTHLRLQDGPKEIASIGWMQSLQKLEYFYLLGIHIGDGDLKPLLELPQLRDVFVSPVRKNYSHDAASFHAAMHSKVNQP